MQKYSREIKCKAIIFDLDGTLVDSAACVEGVWKQWAERYGFDFEKEVLPICHGRPSIYPIKELMPDVTDEELEKMDNEFLEIELALLEGLKPIKGADVLLKSLPMDSWAIATSGTWDLASGRMRSAGLPLPEIMVTAEQITRAKPDPEPFLKAAEKLKIAPKDCVIFEDSPAGIKGAIASGAKVVGINVPEMVLRTLKPDFVVRDLTEVKANVSNGLITIYFK